MTFRRCIHIYSMIYRSSSCLRRIYSLLIRYGTSAYYILLHVYVYAYIYIHYMNMLCSESTVRYLSVY